MATYIVTKIYKYTETVTVEANSKKEAEDAAQSAEGDRNDDDWLYDCQARKEAED